MASRTFHFTTTASTAPVPIANTTVSSAITGYEMMNVAATAVFVKFYWGSASNNASPQFSSGSNTPVVGTDTPALTVAVPAGTAAAPARVALTWTTDAAPRGNGSLFMAVTGAQADSDTTAPAAGIVISVTYW